MYIYTIYKATNVINGKSYIGFDSKWPNRKKCHERNYKDKKTKFYSAIKKHGWNSFIWEIIYQSKDGLHTKNIMENYFIEEYNTYSFYEYSNGYNMTLGGDGTFGLIVSEETKNKLRSSLRGRKLSDKSKDKIRNSLKGISHTTERKEKMKRKRIFSKERKIEEKYQCKFCKKFFNAGALSRHHGIFCKENPDRIEKKPEKPRKKYEMTKKRKQEDLYSCLLCGRLIRGKGNYSQHKNSCVEKL